MAADHHSCIGITEDQLRVVIRETVHETFLTLGIDIEHPLEMQKDFQGLREFRLLLGSMRTKSILVLTGFLVSAMVGAVWLGIKASLR